MGYEASIDAVISANDCVSVSSQTSDLCPYMDLTVRFDVDPIRANLASANICFYEYLMTERLNDRLVQSKYATDIGSTDAANIQYGDVCEFLTLICMIQPSRNIGIHLRVCQIQRLACLQLMH